MTTPIQLTIGITPPHRNQYLFSDHYLDELLRQDPRWSQALPEAETFLGWLQQLYAQEQAQLPQYNESQLEEHWIKPILTQLDHVFEPQASVPGVTFPDYVFFPDEAARQLAASVQKTDEYARHALAVGEAKRWNLDLGKKQKGGGASFEALNPMWQIDYYIRTTDLKWGILTNGRLWRLVHKDTSHRLSIFYGIDLVDLLTRGDAHALPYFTLFFRQAAFLPDDQGRVFLKDALAASSAYAVALEEDLKQNVYQALEWLMQGFLDLPANHLGGDELRTIYDNSLYLLYRLLFILYAESRELLPLANEEYRQHYSLMDIKGDIARKDVPTAPLTTVVWARLQTLFHIISGDDPQLNQHLGVPRYNGGLFDPTLHPFLEEKQVGDRALVEAIDLLCRRTSEAGREFVDYRSLGVRQLGSIYEGLLENQPRYAHGPMAAIRDGNGERWVAASEVPVEARVVEHRAPGRVYMETDRGERKATGSYYTPQYIVEYIVQNTLGPLVDEAVARVKKRAKAAKTKIERALAPQSLVDEILNLKVLDPAMGSGHFLVEATDFLALALATDPYVETDAPAEEDLIHWKRRVVERCIYGVDKNPLAVELAKLSLWLSTVAADRPLSFLDHHLQCGDSLIGARVADLGWPPPVILSKKAQQNLAAEKAGQLNMFEHMLSQRLPVVMGRILEITEVESDTYETVQAKEAADQAIRQLKAPFQAVANLWVSAYFGNQFTVGDYDEVLRLISKPDDLLALPAVKQAQAMTKERNFFHWELAFPELFYDRNGQPLSEKAGFDAVVGNPPYDVLAERERHEDLSNVFSYFEANPDLKPALGRKLDLFRLFTSKATNLVAPRRSVGFIIPMSLLTDQHTFNLRHYLLIHQQIQRVEAFPQKDDPTRRVFPEAKLPTCVVVIANSVMTTGLIEINVHPGRLLEETCGKYQISPQQIQQFDPESLMIPILSSQAGVTLAVRLASSPRLQRLGDVLRSFQGEINETTMASLLSLDSSAGPKVLRGSNVQRYEFMQKAKQGVNKYLDVSRYKTEMGGTRVHHTQAPRIGYQRNAALDNWRRLIFCPLPCPTYCFDSVSYFLVEDEKRAKASLALLNSQLLEWRFRLTSSNNHVSTSEISALPVPRFDSTTRSEERHQLVAQAEALYEADHYTEVLSFTDDRLAAVPKQTDVVHDLLAHLAGQMIEMHKARNAEMGGFLDWLAGYTGLPIEEWSLKTSLKVYYQYDWTEMQRVLDRNRRRIKKVDVVGREALERIRREYEASAGKLQPLLARIAATDRLIDLLVYKLYGLTDEEIAIVEGDA